MRIEKEFHLENILQDKSLKGHITTYLNQNILFNDFIYEGPRQSILDITYKMDHNKNVSNSELKYVTKQLSQIKFDIFGRYLQGDLLEKYLEIFNLYNNDQYVLKRKNVVKNMDYENFMNMFEDVLESSLLVIKGMRDIFALKNMYKLILNKDINLYNYYDIETFNGFSHNFYKNSQLEETYNGLIQTKIYKGVAREFFNKITSNFENKKAHNPLVDSLFTIVVAITMNLAINTYFTTHQLVPIKNSRNRKHGGGDHKIIVSDYYSKYIKYKTKYIELKTNNSIKTNK
jgi:hypothetical protein